MDFSEVFAVNDKLSVFSPDGVHLAHVDGHYKVQVRECKSLLVQHSFCCPDQVSTVEWSHDSTMLMCAMHKRALVHIFSLHLPQWNCKIDEGSFGLGGTLWSPDDKCVLTTSEFNLRITVWSLVSKAVSYIKYPKKANPGLEFSGDGQYLAVAERREQADCVSVFGVRRGWSLAAHFPVATSDLTALHWAPDSVSLALMETCTEVKLLFYSILGQLLSTVSPYSVGLGLKTIAFSPTGQFCAAGFYDQSIHIVPYITWKPIAKFTHPPCIKPHQQSLPPSAVATADNSCNSTTGDRTAMASPNPTVYKEVEFKTQALAASAIVNMQPSGPLSVKQVKYEVVEKRPFLIPSTWPDPEKPNPKLGPGLVSFSSNGLYLLSRNDNQPCTLYVWNMRTLCVESVLQQSEPVCAAEWDPVHCTLALVTGTSKVFLWSPEGCVAVRMAPATATDGSPLAPHPAPSIQATDVKWHPDGHKFMILGKHSFVMCYPKQVLSQD